MDSKRKRIKLECLECGSVFNNDYKLKHKRDVHGGKKIKIQHFGAPSNPFTAAKIRKNKQLVSFIYIYFLNNCTTFLPTINKITSFIFILITKYNIL